MSFYQLDFYSDILQREADVLIAAPAKQEDDCQVVYLLHGGMAAATRTTSRSCRRRSGCRSGKSSFRR